jgi:hypothetical protein
MHEPILVWILVPVIVITYFFAVCTTNFLSKSEVNDG